jgi:adenylate cyclase
MARQRRGESTVAHFELAQANRERVLVESSLKGELVVARIRLALIVLFLLSYVGVGRVAGVPVVPDPPRQWAVVLYLVFAVTAFFLLRFHARPDPRRATWLPILTSFIDFGYTTFMAWRSQVLGNFQPMMMAATCAVFITFSVARYKLLHVVLATALAVGSFILVNWLGQAGVAAAVPVSFVVGCYIGLGLLIGWANREVGGMFLQAWQRQNLSRFLPQPVLERVMNLGTDTVLAPVQREITILFSDIRDFTTLSETLPPQVVMELLGDYFSHMAQIVQGHNGIVNKFLGDGMLACWGVPDASDDHAVRAMRAALDMRVKLEELNAWRQQRGEPPLRIGIGLHTGAVAAGMLGGAGQHEYTVIGDAVNLASRVEGLTKTLGVDILVSESTWNQGQGRFVGERISEEPVKGRRERVVVYSLQGRRPSSSESSRTRAG